jgi:very-short-patch-repair endonuclease
MSVAQRPSRGKESADMRAALRAARQFGLVAYRQALDCGLSRSSISRRVASGAWLRVLPRVYRLASTPESWCQRALAACLWAGDGSALSHKAAAHLWGFEGFRECPVDVMTSRSLRVAAPWLVIHRVQGLIPFDVTRKEGIPVTTPSRTLLELGAVCDEGAVDIAIDSAVRDGLVSMERLQRQLEVSGTNGCRGTSVLRRLLHVRGRSYRPMDSGGEIRFRRLLSKFGLPQPQHQYPSRAGTRRIDFAYPEAMLAIEIDGFDPHSGKKAWQHDRARQNELVAEGWTVVRFTWDDLVYRSSDVAGLIRQFLYASGSLGGTDVEKKA